MKIREMLAQKMNEQIGRSQTEILERVAAEETYAQIKGRERLHARILEYLPPEEGGHILELGCGPGKYVALLGTVGFSVVGADPLEFPTWDLLRENPSVSLMSGIFAESLPYPDASFDHVVCLGALLYFADPSKAMLEIKRVVRPGGKLIIRNVNRTNLYTTCTGRPLDPASNNLYTMEELQDFCEENGFEVLDSFAYGFWPPFFTNFFWYLSCVLFSDRFVEALSRLLPVNRRLNLTVCLRKKQ